MTPEERAGRLVDQHYPDVMGGQRIAEAIREAVAAERERIAALAVELEATWQEEEANPHPPGGWIITRHSFADRIREGA
jgi:hypothetical protein